MNGPAATVTSIGELWAVPITLRMVLIENLRRSIAMGQGPSEVRAAADRVTGSNEADGVAHAIDEIVLAQVGW